MCTQYIMIYNSRGDAYLKTIGIMSGRDKILDLFALLAESSMEHHNQN